MNVEAWMAAWRLQVEERLKPLSPKSAIPLLKMLVHDLRQQDELERRRAAVRLQGHLRRWDTEVRLDLTGMLLKSLGLTPTQHVGRIVMREVFGVAASTAALTERFATPARDARVKYAPAARAALADADPALLESAREARAWVQRRLRSCVADLKAR